MEGFIILLLLLMGGGLLFTYKVWPKLKDSEVFSDIRDMYTEWRAKAAAEKHVRDRYPDWNRFDKKHPSDFVEMVRETLPKVTAKEYGRRSAIDQETREACDSLERNTAMVCTIMQSVVRDEGGRGWFISDALLASRDTTGDAKEYLWKVTGGRIRRKGRI